MVEWERRVVLECNEIDGFHLAVVNRVRSEESILQNDLFLLSKDKVIKLNWLLLKFCLFFFSSRFSIYCEYYAIYIWTKYLRKNRKCILGHFASSLNYVIYLFVYFLGGGEVRWWFLWSLIGWAKWYYYLSRCEILVVLGSTYTDHRK